MEKYKSVTGQFELKLTEVKPSKMDCLKTSRLSGPCSVCRKFDDPVHVVGTELYCGRHCIVCEEAPHLVIAGEPNRSVIQALDKELIGVG